MKKVLPLLLIFGVVPMILLMLLWRDRCNETVVSSHVSPDGERLAVVSHKDCGPAVAVATEVRLGPRDPRTEQNFKGGTTQVLLLQGVVDLSLFWKSPRNLAVSYPTGSVLVNRRPASDDVQITFSSK
jgi:hypothetical protein